jgi:hypothetical protein
LGFSAHAFSDAAARRRFQTFSGFFNNLLVAGFYSNYSKRQVISTLNLNTLSQ